MSALILGHKNPDTDSIVSAIVCADLYKKRGLDVVPAAQGKPAPETQFVLERFGFEAPEVVTSVAGRDVYLVDFSDRAQLRPTSTKPTSRASSTTTSSAT